jgi:hypothetical protein
MPRVMVVRKDHLRDCQGVWQSQVIVPKDLAGVVGRRYFIQTTKVRNTGPTSRTKAADTPRHIEFVADALLRIKAAKEAQRVVEPPRMLGRYVELSRTSHTRLQPGMQLNGRGRVMTGRDGQQYLVEDLSIAPTIKLAGCSTATAMALWKVKRGDNPPRQQAIDSRKSKMTKFFAHIGKPDDLTGVTPAEIQGYKEYLLKQGGPGSNLARDHLTDILALFQVADENHKFDGLPGGNPAAKIVLPPNREGLKRLAFTDDDAKKILVAARESDKPIIRWGMWLDAFLGTITEEISDALVRHVKTVNGIPCIDITPEGRTTIVDGEKQTAKLKTAFRPRLLPLHPALIREGFLDHVEYVRREYGDHAPLFPEVKPDKCGQRNTKASDLIMAFLRGIGIKNETDPDTGTTTALRDSYSWRHRFASQLQDTGHIRGSTPERRRFITGHAGSDVHENVYLKHPPAKLKLDLLGPRSRSEASEA